MKRDEAERRGESEVFRRANGSHAVFARKDSAHENIEVRQLRVLCVGMAGLIAADALLLIYFWTM